MRKVGIFGGSFNPIHIGHLLLAQEALEHFELEKVLLIPTADNPLKRKITDIDKCDRFELVRLSAEGNDRFEVSDIEINSKKANYTIDTVRQLKEMDEAEYYFICGADIILDIERWKDFDILFSLMKFALAARPGYKEERLNAHVNYLRDRYQAQIDIFYAPLIDLSSTDIRRRIGADRSVRYMISDKVYDYIIQNKMYLEQVDE